MNHAEQRRAEQTQQSRGEQSAVAECWCNRSCCPRASPPPSLLCRQLTDDATAATTHCSGKPIKCSEVPEWRAIRYFEGGSVIKLSRFRRQRRLCLSIAALCTLCTARSPICLGKVPPSNERSRSCNKFHIYHPSMETEGGAGKFF